MAIKQPILYWNRSESREEEEKVYADGPLQWLYETRPGQWLTDGLLTRRWFSKMVGLYQSSPLSRNRVRSFAKRFDIQMDEFLEEPYRSFNDFFVRRFKPGRRIFCPAPGEFPAFAEGRYVVHDEVRGGDSFPVKGENLSPIGLLGGEARAEPFLGGPLLIARLCPTDYHRFHYPDGGSTLEHFRIPGRLHSVNPVALRFRGDIFRTNERRVSLLQTENFGRLAYIEVGALNVGKIVQTHPSSAPFERGMEKGYFLFGGSTILVLGERGRWRPDKDLLERTARRQEVLVRLGEKIATMNA